MEEIITQGTRVEILRPNGCWKHGIVNSIDPYTNMAFVQYSGQCFGGKFALSDLEIKAPTKEPSPEEVRRELRAKMERIDQKIKRCPPNKEKALAMLVERYNRYADLVRQTYS